MTSQRSRPSRLEALRRVGEKIYHDRQDLQDAFASTTSTDFWYWLHWHGPEEYDEVAELLYPIPDSFLRDRVVGEGVDDRTFRHGGLVDWRQMESCLAAAGHDFDQSGAVLDFGCGCGRILRYFGLHAPKTSVWGVDVDGEAVDWCHRNLGPAEFLRVDFEPPSPFPTGRFQAVIAFSVFSHLPEERHLAWLDELARITSPGAVVVLTVQGEEVVRKMLAGEVSDPSLPAETLEASLDDIRQRGFGFFPYRELKPRDERNVSTFSEWDLEAYGNTFIYRSYIDRHWTRYFEVVELRLAPDGWQDYVVLRRRARSAPRPAAQSK